MFSTAQIISKTNAKSFDRGNAIAQSPDKVDERHYYSDRSGCEISARVKSASAITERFKSYVFLDPDCEEIESYECNCPAARKYSVMCKHCVATALSFKRDPESFDGYSQRNMRVTTRALKRFLESTTQYDSLAADAQDVHITTELTNDFGSWSARFRVTKDNNSYVVSDISEFANAINNAKYLSYGKKLGFIHSLDAFDPASRKVAEFIAISKSSKEARRELRLDDVDVVNLLDAIGDSSFDYNEISTNTDLHDIHVRQSDPKILFEIIEDNDGYSIEMPTDVSVLSAGGHAYIFQPDGVYRASGKLLRAATFLRTVGEESDGEIFITSEDMPEFCINVLPGLEEGAQVVEPAELAQMKPSKPSFEFYFDREGRGESNRVTLAANVSYGDREYPLISLVDHAPDTNKASDVSKELATTTSLDETPLIFGTTEDGSYRNIAAENKILELITNYIQDDLTLPLSKDQEVGELLFEGLKAFQSVGTVYTTPAFDRLLSDAPVKVDIGISLAGNLIDLDIRSSDVSREELSRILSSYRQKKQYHKLKDGRIASLKALELDEFERIAEDLGLTLEDVRKGKAQIPAFNAFLLDREYSNITRNKSFDDYIERFDNDSLYDYEIPPELETIMRPYQKEGYLWLRKLGEIGFGGILADEMGLGKSLQAIAYILALKEEGKLDEPTLIVCPASLVYNWVEEFAKFAPHITVEPIDGIRFERRRKLSNSNADVLIASYDTVRIDLEKFEDMHFSNVFLDETQYIKNHGTKTTRAIKRLKAKNRFALTGTPIENKLSELWSIFDFLMPGFLGSYAQFRTRFESDIIGGDEDAAARLSALVEPFVLRRLKEDVLSELPEKQEIVTFVNLPEEQRKLYDANEQNLREDLLAQRKARRATSNGRTSGQNGLQVDVLAELLRLRQVSLDPSLIYHDLEGPSAKTAAVFDLIDQAMASGRKSLVFSQFTSYLDILKDELSARGIPFYEITGATDKKERVRLVNEFNSDDVPVFLVSLKAGGTGLNLTGASVVIHTDPWWNAAAIDQATDRAHRIGQKNMVNVYRLIAKDTIEERILRLQEAKSNLADSIISDNSLASLRSLTRNELESLLLD